MSFATKGEKGKRDLGQRPGRGGQGRFLRFRRAEAERGEDGLEDDAAIIAAEMRIAGAFRVWHEAEDIAAFVHDAGDVLGRGVCRVGAARAPHLRARARLRPR